MNEIERSEKILITTLTQCKIMQTVRMIDLFPFHEQSNENEANTWIASSFMNCTISKFICSSLWSDYNLKGGNSLSLSNFSLKTRLLLSLIRIAHKLTQLHTRFHTGRKRRTHIKWALIQLSSFTHSHFTIHIFIFDKYSSDASAHFLLFYLNFFLTQIPCLFSTIREISCELHGKNQWCTCESRTRSGQLHSLLSSFFNTKCHWTVSGDAFWSYRFNIGRTGNGISKGHWCELFSSNKKVDK